MYILLEENNISSQEAWLKELVAAAVKMNYSFLTRQIPQQ